MKEVLKRNKAITLIALVITIIVLLILAGVSISMISTESGILGQAEKASKNTEISNIKEGITIDIVGKELDEVISYKDLEEILSKYGTVTYEDEENTIPKGVYPKKHSDEEILLSDLWDGTAVPHIENPNGSINLDFIFVQTGATEEDSFGKSYEINKVSYINTNNFNYTIQPVWFTSSTVFPIQFKYNKKREYANKNTLKISKGLNKVALAAGNLDVKVEGLDETENNYEIRWNDPIRINMKLSNNGNLNATGTIKFTSSSEWDENMQKYLKIKVVNEDGTVQECSQEGVFSSDGASLNIGSINVGEVKKLNIEIVLQYED